MNIYSDTFQQYEHKQKYTSKRKDTSKETYDKARDKASRLKSDYRLVQGYREVRASKREWREE